jgi:hypothetical protein
MKLLIKQRGYQAVSAFDTVWKSPNLVYAIYVKNNKLGILDITGKEITPAKYDDIPGMNRSHGSTIGGFHNNFVVRINKNEGLISNKGKELVPALYETLDYNIRSERANRAGLYPDSLYEARLGDELLYLDVKGQVLWRREIGEEMKIGDVMDMPKEDYSPPVIDEGRDWESYQAPTGIPGHKLVVRTEAYKTVYGVIDENTRREIFPTEYQRIQVDQFGNYQLTKNNRYGLADKNGVVKVPVELTGLYNYPSVYQATRENKYALYSRRLEPVTGFVFDHYINYADNNFLVLRKDGKWGAVDSAGREKIPFIYDDLHLTTDCHYARPFITATLNKKKGFIDINGKQLLPFEYDELIPECRVESEGRLTHGHFYSNAANKYYFFKKDGRYGILGKDFKVLVPPVYHNMEKSMHDELAYVRVDSGTQRRWGLLHIKTNKLIVPVAYDRILYHRGGYFHYDKYFSGGYYSLRSGSKVAIYDQDGKQWMSSRDIPDILVRDIYNGLLHVTTPDGPPLYIDYNGNGSK